ncbi:MAG: type I restriction endonuclease subunit S [Rhodobacterales bacterium]|nr:MAG: type I restriction endonuclease subunit S [Rhodobacterales bacterium]
MKGKIDISPEQLKIVQGILKDHLPGGTLAWAFGSRVTWTAKPFSDLDIALEGAAPLPSDVLIDLDEAFEASDLPWKVDVIDLNAVSPEFRAIVERQRVPADWEEINLSEVFIVSSGLSKPRSEFGSGFPFLTFKDVFYNTFIPSELGGLVASTESERAKHSIQRGDVFLTRTSETFDELGMSCVALANIPHATFNGFTKRLRPKKPKKIIPEYLGYYFKSPKFRSAVNAVSTMSTRASLNNSMLAVLPLVLPPLFEQSNIAQVLKAFDDKIELNRRMNETLEAMARAVFRDWFVDFGPTRRKAAGITNPAAILGGLLPDPTKAADLAALFPDRFGAKDLPEGWEKRPLDKIADFLNGLALQKYPAKPHEDSLPVIKIAELRNGVSAKSNRASREVPEKYILKDGDYIFSWSGSLMAKYWTEGEGALNQHLFKVTSKSHPMWVVSGWVEHHLAEFQRIAAAKAVTMGHIKRSHLSEAMCVLPHEKALELMGQVIEPLMALIIQNSLENQTLAATRDLLLPKLMSGDLRLTGTEGAA